MKDFKGKVAVITGGASGVGKAIGERLGREGVKLVIADIQQAAIDTALADFKAKGIEAIGHVTDVSKLESVEALAEKSFSHYGAVHLLFNNAGVGPREAQTGWESGMNEYIWGMNVNFYGVVHGVKAFMPRLIAQNVEAHVINTTSTNGGLLALTQSSVYAATKAAVSAFTETIHYQLLTMNSPIKVSLLFPGPHIVRTGLFDSNRVRPSDLPADPTAFDIGIKTADELQKMMENYGVKMEITTPDEVAENMFQDLQQDIFWMFRNTDKVTQAITDRYQSIMARSNPTPPNTN